MKGVILGINPRARLVDLSHEIPPQDVRAAALLLETAVDAFPRGSVHLCVVDPGVGSARAAIVLRARGQFFVAPDNGLLTPIMACAPGEVARAIDHPLLRRPEVSRTFHGRDLFAVAAARLTLGFPFARVGPIVESPVRLPFPRPVRRGATLCGEVIAIDRFGSASTNIRAEDLSEAVEIRCDGIPFGPLRDYYAQVRPGSKVALINSAGRLEVAINGGSAEALGARVGSLIEVTLSAPDNSEDVDGARGENSDDSEGNRRLDHHQQLGPPGEHGGIGG